MILGKNNLLAVAMSNPDKDIPVLDCLFIERDGTTVAGSRKAILCVSPIDEEIKEGVQLRENKCNSVSVSSETIKDVLKIIPRDLKYGGLLEHVDIRETDKGIIFTTTDGKRQKQIAGKIVDHRYTNYREIIKRALTTRESKQIVLNRKRLLSLLDTMEKICPDSSGKSLIYIEFTENNDIVLRCENRKSRQRAIGVMWSYTGVEGKWMDLDDWENGFIDNEDMSLRNINLQLKNRNDFKSEVEGLKKIVKSRKIRKIKKSYKKK